MLLTYGKSQLNEKRELLFCVTLWDALLYVPELTGKNWCEYICLTSEHLFPSFLSIDVIDMLLTQIGSSVVLCGAFDFCDCLLILHSSWISIPCSLPYWAKHLFVLSWVSLRFSTLVRGLAASFFVTLCYLAAYLFLWAGLFHLYNSQIFYLTIAQKVILLFRNEGNKIILFFNDSPSYNIF